MDSILKDSFIGSFRQPPNSFPVTDFESRPSSLKHSNPHSCDPLQAPNSKALLSALKTLQEKICRLELEKSQVHNRLTSLSREAAEVSKKEQLVPERETKETAQHERQKHVVTPQLNATQQRCSLLEKQLDYMRTMVQSAEMEKNAVLEQQTLLQREKDNMQVESKLEKLDVLEKECLRLTATQRLAENKIQQLEEKLCTEEQQRKIIQDKAAQIQTGLEVSRILMSSVSTGNAPQKNNQKKKQVKKKTANSGSLQQPFYPKAGELPFVAGKSTHSSHSLSANVQTVLHMMKHQSQRVTPQRPVHRERKCFRMSSASRGISRPSSSTTNDSLSDILMALQDELEQMSFEHQDLLKQIHETKNNEVCEDLERELDCLVKQMETKSDQILKLKKHQENVAKLKKKAQSMKKLASNAKSTVHIEGGRSEVPTTPQSSQRNLTRSTPIPRSKTSLELLKNVQKIQMTLKKDDIMWEK
ncbi:centrosomal protein CEP57L1 isoform 2-T3 [Discoglossus pictus]